jgi:CHAT domain-containing protein/tetratricopeptide (TPR) repeat protein
LERAITGRTRGLLPLKTACAWIGSTLLALLLCGSSRTAASPTFLPDSHAASEMKRLYTEGARLYASAEYSHARQAFLQAADFAHQAGDESKAAFDWNNAGHCSILTMQFGAALVQLKHARQIAEVAHQSRPLLYSLNSLAALYIHMGQFDQAIVTAREALNGPAGHADAGMRALLLCEIGEATAELKRFDEAVPYYIDGINGLLDADDPDMAVIVLGDFGDDSLKERRFDLAEWALGEGLHLLRIKGQDTSAGILRALAKMKSLQGKPEQAAALYLAALDTPPGPTPRWGIFAERGRFRLESGDLTGSLADYREARRIVARMRVDMVPADQDRVTFESGLSDILEGLVDAGNRLARQNGDRAVLRETFDAAEQDRLWSLRALVPTPNDWRARLPEHYWELLGQFQTLERASSGTEHSGITQPKPDLEKQLMRLGTELQQIEANAAGNSATVEEIAESPLDHVKSVLDDDSVLLSFHISKTSSWVWAVDRRDVEVYSLPPARQLEAETTAFARAVRDGAPSTTLGAQLYRDLLGRVPDRYLHHSKWRLELDGPLYELPFAALVVAEDSRGPVFLMQRVVLQAVPGALLLKRDAIPGDGELLAIGDPIYNTADSRYTGTRGPAQLTLPRLPNTAAEIEACTRAWNSPSPALLTGANARPAAVEAAMARNPAIVHFATHVISGPGDFHSGLIALSLDSSGAMGLLGPKDIVARPIAAKLVVMNGCHSSQGQALPSAGLMGLTRAWIGAGASAVLATQWDVPDGEAKSFITEFYRVLRAAPDRGAAYALREAQLSALRNREPEPSWAAYSLLSRMP